MTSPSLSGRVDAVVIGTSAGGVEALSQVLPVLPADCRVPVMVVIHLPRERPSLLADIFRQKCALRVIEAQDKEAIAPGTVYFAPPDYHLLVDDGPSLALSDDELVNFSRPAIDVLFESAAECYRHRLCGVLLTGASHDGAAGLAAIRRAGGVTIVQQPETAHAATMVEAALKKGPVDHVLTLADLASLLLTLDRGPAS